MRHLLAAARGKNVLYITAPLLAVSIAAAAHGQSYDPLRQREVDAAERTAAAVERLEDAARRESIERCFARGERERCMAMMTPSEQLSFTSMEASRMAGRGLGQAASALIGGSSAEQGAAARLRALHPDYEEILADPAFRRWVNESPTRREMLLKANAEYDVSAADMVFSAWKQLRSR